MDISGKGSITARSEKMYDWPWLAGTFICEECGRKSESLAMKPLEQFYACQCGASYLIALVASVKRIPDVGLELKLIGA